jgi:hypothetical protein
MDGRTFDHFTKSLSRGASRRQMLGGLGAVAAGLLTWRSAAAKARPANNGSGCAQPERICTPEGGCCGSKLTCTVPSELSAQCLACTSGEGNAKCCFAPGTACHGHCECCAPATGCINGVCTVLSS